MGKFPAPDNAKNPFLHPVRGKNALFALGEKRLVAAERPNPLAVWDVDGEAAEAGFLVLLVHVAAGLAHGFDADIKAD